MTEEQRTPAMDDSHLQSAHTPEERLQALAAWGVDLSLTVRMLQRTPAERVAGVLETSDGFVQRSIFERLLCPPKHPQPPRLLFQRLMEAEVDWVLIGRLAEIAQGAPLLADHMEACFRPDTQNVVRLMTALSALRPHLRDGTRHERSPRFFAQHGTRLLLEQTTLALDTESACFLLQQHLPGVGAYPTVKQAAIPLDLYGYQMLVLSLSALMARRQARGLTEDEVFLPQLEAAYLLTTNPPKQHAQPHNNQPTGMQQ